MIVIDALCLQLVSRWDQYILFMQLYIIIPASLVDFTLSIGQQLFLFWIKKSQIRCLALLVDFMWLFIIFKFVIKEGTNFKNVTDLDSKRYIQTISYFLYFFNDMVRAVFLPIKFSWWSFDFNVFNPDPYYLANFVFQVAIKFVVFKRLINLCMCKRFYYFFMYCTNFFNSALIFNRLFLNKTVFLNSIKCDYVWSRFLPVHNPK